MRPLNNADTDGFKCRIVLGISNESGIVELGITLLNSDENGASYVPRRTQYEDRLSAQFGADQRWLVSHSVQVLGGVVGRWDNFEKTNVPAVTQHRYTGDPRSMTQC